MFSSTIKISSISDYITPTQECVKPLMRNAKIDIDDSALLSKPDLIKKKENVAKVSLQDCLACSGCITTAETILIETQSIQEFLAQVAVAKAPAIVISPQSRASLAFRFNVTDTEMHSLLQVYFATLKTKVYDLQDYISMALLLAQQEFQGSSGVQPILCSECPGWVCYAEKTIDEFIIPHMSRVKSPQQLFAVINKEQHDYLAAIMPCYDKKLEAVRIENQGEIQTVLGTREMEEILQEFISQIQQQPAIQQQTTLFSSYKNTEVYQNPTSNNYLDYIIESFIHTNNLDKAEVISKPRRNNDFIEITIMQDGIIKGMFARVYGLKNIANLIQQIKSKICKYLYVEIMACPQGCINGGAQLKATNLKSIELSDKLKSIMINGKVLQPQLMQTPLEPQRCLTSFKHIPKMESNFYW